MNHNKVFFYDFETGGKNPHTCQITQLAGVMIDLRKLQVIAGSAFNSEVRPILEDGEAKTAGVAPIEEEALNVTGKTREQLAKAPGPKAVFNAFSEHIARYNPGGRQWGAPIRAGYNINNYDNIILDRLCQQYGYFDKERNSQKLFHPIYSIDLLPIMWSLFENEKKVKSLSFDNLRKFFGLSKEGAHDALIDCLQGAALFIRYHKWLRSMSQRTKFEGSMTNEVIAIQDYVSV